MVYEKDLRKIADHYGADIQRAKAVEELAELIRALVRDNLLNVAEEIADVEIMIYQLKYLYALDAAVEDMAESEIRRQLKRIREEGN